MTSGNQALPSYYIDVSILTFIQIKAFFPLVLRIVRIGDFYDILTSGILLTSVNTLSQTVGDFYDVIGRIGSISTLEVLIPDIRDVGDFYDEC